MAITFTNLSGTRENLDKTIATLLSNNWTAANITGTITPKFENDTSAPDYIAKEDKSSLNMINVNFISRTRMNDFDSNGDSKHAWKQELRIGIMGETLSVLTQMEDEVNRILWTYAPNGGTRLNKSDTSASEAAYFEQSEIEFFRIGPDNEEEDYTPASEGTLLIIYYRLKT